ncbi:MAG: ParB/RepB/Spo0J family partition protein [Bacteroidota bacterium]
MNAKKRALGKGLGALLEDSSAIDNAARYDINKDLHAVGTVAHVPLNLINSNPYQPRTDFDEETLQELANSIKEQGVIQPVTIRKQEDGKFQLISGERRCRAAKLAGLNEVPAYIRSANDQEMREMAIVENIQRENLNPIEVAMGYQQLLDEFKLTQEMLSERLGKSRSSIANHLRLLKLPGDIQIGLRQELITNGHARALISLEDHQTQLEIFQDIIEQGLSVRDTEEIVRNLSMEKEQKEQNSEEESQKPKIQRSKTKYPELQKTLSSFYGSKVQIKSRSDGKGTIVISFSSEQDLERINKLLQHTD